MNAEKFTFDLVDKYKPEVVIENAIKQIEKATKGYVKGYIKEYDGYIRSHTKTNNTGINAALGAFSNNTETVKVDIQDSLGVRDEEKNRFEVFISAKGLEHYKYRMLFIDYGTVSYPVTIVLNEDLAVEYCQKRSYNFLISSMSELEDMMEKIINSPTMIDLIQSLINEAIRHENKGDAEE